MFLNNIVIEADENMENLAEIVEGVTFLCSTTTGTYPMNRDFGIDQDFMDEPITAVRPLLAIEYKEKIERYEPRVEVLDVWFEYDEDTGALTPHVELDLITQSEEDEELEEEYEEEDDV